MKPFHGKRKLLVRVNGKAGMVALQITIKLGRKTHTYTRFVPANQQDRGEEPAHPGKDREGDRVADRPARPNGKTGVRWGGPLRRASPTSGP